MAREDAAVAQAACLQHKQQLGQQPLQLVDGPALDCRALKAALYQAPPHRLQPACTHTGTQLTTVCDSSMHFLLLRQRPVCQGGPRHTVAFG